SSSPAPTPTQNGTQTGADPIGKDSPRTAITGRSDAATAPDNEKHMLMASKVAINGLGRIGRAALKLVLAQPQLEVGPVNEIGSLDNMVYLLRYDTVYGRYERQVDAVDGKLVIDGKPLVYLSERDPERLPWAGLEGDLVVRGTGRVPQP